MVGYEFKNGQKTLRTYKSKDYALVAHVTKDGTTFTVDGVKGDFPSMGAAAAMIAKWPKRDGSGYVVPDGPRFWGLRKAAVKAPAPAGSPKAKLTAKVAAIVAKAPVKAKVARPTPIATAPKATAKATKPKVASAA